VPEALREVERTAPDVAVVDVRLPGGSGIELIREIRARRPETRCLILTSFPAVQAFYQSVVAGASGFVVKDVAQRELIDALRRVAAGETLDRPEIIDDLRRRARDLPPDDVFLADLTGQERRILAYVAMGRTNREIAADLSLAEKTVRNYMSTVLSKLGMKNRTQVAAYVAHSAARRPNGPGVSTL
jgi:DNA-binding NarL/FixJ family response regulator